MSTTVERLRRNMVFVPGNLREHIMEAANDDQIDSVMLDLEDFAAQGLVLSDQAIADLGQRGDKGILQGVNGRRLGLRFRIWLGTERQPGRGQDRQTDQSRRADFEELR